MSYPTKEEILDNPVKHKEETLEIVKTWKDATWKNVKGESLRIKFEAVKELIDKLAVLYDKPVRVEFAPDVPSCCYSPQVNTIFINSSVSIISAFHEFAHRMFGPSEKKACRWSVWLFKKTFEKAFEKLTWRGHLLVKRNE